MISSHIQVPESALTINMVIRINTIIWGTQSLTEGFHWAEISLAGISQYSSIDVKGAAAISTGWGSSLLWLGVFFPQSGRAALSILESTGKKQPHVLVTIACYCWRKYYTLCASAQTAVTERHLHLWELYLSTLDIIQFYWAVFTLTGFIYFLCV